MALMYNCNNGVVVFALISELQVSHSFYKPLVKHEVTKMRHILTHAHKYIQIEDATRSSANHSPKRGGEVEKQKAQPIPPKKTRARQSDLSTSPLGILPRPMGMKPT